MPELSGEAAVTALEEIIRKVPRTDAVWLTFWIVRPDPASIPPLKKSFDRDGDLLSQVKEHMESHGYRGGPYTVKVNARGHAKVEFGDRNITVLLKAPEPAPPRVENPVVPQLSAADLTTEALIAELEKGKRLRIAAVGKCKGCGEPRTDCVCEPQCRDCQQPESKCTCECDDCGFPLAQCSCQEDDEEEPTALGAVADAVVKRLATEDGGRVVDRAVDAFVDLFEAGADRLRFGPRKREDVPTATATATSVAKKAGGS